VIHRKKLIPVVPAYNVPTETAAITVETTPELPLQKSIARPVDPAIVCAFFGMICVIILARLHTYYEPFERDLTNYSMISHELLNGRRLYADVWDQKPPGIFVAYAIAEKLAGHGPGQIFLMNIAAAIVTLCAVYKAGSSGGAGRMGGLWAAMFWTLICSDLYLQANQPNTEVFINAFVAMAFAVLLGSVETGLGWRKALIVGLLLAAGSLFKHAIVIVPFFFCAVYVVLQWRDKKQRIAALKDLAIIVGTGCAVWLALFGYFAIRGSFGAFYKAVFVFNSYYAENPFANLVAGFKPLALFPDFYWRAIPLLVALIAALVIGITTGIRRPSYLLLAYWMGTQITLALFGEGQVTLAIGGVRPRVGHGYPHYYQLLLPSLCIGAGWLIPFSARLHAKIPRWAPTTLGIFLGVLMASLELPSFRWSADDWSRTKYGDVFVEEDQVGKFLGRALAPNETFYVWGAESNLYYAADRRPPSGGVFTFYAMLAGPMVTELTNRTLADLQRTPPDLLVIYKPSYNQTQNEHPVIKWVASRYDPVPETMNQGNYALLVKHGSDLTQRLRAAMNPANAPHS
jgi:hypothetical protein